MSAVPSDTRREAIKRAQAAAVRLAILPDLREVIRQHLAIVNGRGQTARFSFTDQEAWDSVQTLEHLLPHRTIVR